MRLSEQEIDAIRKMIVDTEKLKNDMSKVKDIWDLMSARDCLRRYALIHKVRIENLFSKHELLNNISKSSMNSVIRQEMDEHGWGYDKAKMVAKDYFRNKDNEIIFAEDINEREMIYLYIDKAKEVARKINLYKYYMVEFSSEKRAFVMAPNQDDAIYLANSLKMGQRIAGHITAVYEIEAIEQVNNIDYVA